MAEVRVGIVGFGKIARDQHVPAIAADPRFRLGAVVSSHQQPALDVPVFPDLTAMLDAHAVDAVAICTPPGPRHAIARQCLEAGLDVLLEKPPAATVGEVADLAALAGRRGRVLFAAWHSQFAPMVARAAAITRAEGIASLAIRWLEDVEKWHPDQPWIWQPGGFGVFDPGINALSIATRLCPEPLLVRAADLVLHEDGQQPEAATLALGLPGAGGDLTARFDWRHRGEEEWTIEVVTRRGTRLRLSAGGAALALDDAPAERAPDREYPAIYDRFGQLLSERRSEVDAEPLRLVADALLIARRHRPGTGG